MAIATISVNFASAAEVYSAGALTTIKSINPSVLKSAFTTGGSFAWTPYINTFQLATSLAVRNTNALKAIHVGTGTTAPATSTANAILVNTTGAGAVAALIARNDTNTVESVHAVSSTLSYIGTVSNHALQLWTNNGAKVYIDGTGNVGIGAASSGAILHLTATTADVRLQGATRTFELESNAIDASGSFNIQDITAGASRIFIGSTGNVGIGQTSVGTYKLDVNGTGRFASNLFITSGTASTVFTNGALVVTGGVGISGALNVQGDITAFATSDERLKDNKTTIANALEKINNISGIAFDWNEKSEKTGSDYGVIAQEIEKILPNAVVTRDNGYKAVKYDSLIPLLIEAIKELNAKIGN
jgi:hypothetical protein